MVKIKTSTARRVSSRGPKKINIKKFKKVNPLTYLTSEKNVGMAILECLQKNDPEGVMEAIDTYLDALDKAKAIKNSGVAKSTYYHSRKNKNPTVKTLAKIVSSCVKNAA